ncbi:hypothetical protein [Paenibacillus sp. L3-i20]|uniref:hypothetical protein n=1 Tax=Paenibacillus sp. L3-i20 TaxID=2905833 RepID=UPI001EE0434F|nr:hypothetical protein [Paenibacillus sp. L3-i20]GKU79840.1 hypothetical protein L3i20_v242370 [Paenibacillus sp. L3-i20]
MKSKTESLLRVGKPKNHEHECISDISKLANQDNKKRSIFSQYFDFEINSDRLLEVSKGNKKLVDEVMQLVEEHQKEDRSISGFKSIQTFYITKKDVDDIQEWIHVVFDHGHGVTLIAGRVGRADHTYKQFMDKSNIYSMANMMQNG